MVRDQLLRKYKQLATDNIWQSEVSVFREAPTVKYIKKHANGQKKNRDRYVSEYTQRYDLRMQEVANSQLISKLRDLPDPMLSAFETSLKQIKAENMLQQIQLLGRHQKL